MISACRKAKGGVGSAVETAHATSAWVWYLDGPVPPVTMPVTTCCNCRWNKIRHRGAADLEMRAVAPIWVDRATCAAGDRAAFRELSTLWRSYLSIWSTSKLAELMPPRIQRGWPVLSGRWCLGVSAALKPVRPRAGKQSPALACIEAGHVAAHSSCYAC